MAMMEALFGKSAGCEIALLITLARAVEAEISANLVPGREADREVFQLALAEFDSRLEEGKKPDDIVAATLALLAAAAVYNRETRAFFEDSREKIDRLVDLMNCTVGLVFTDAEETAAEVAAFDNELETAAARNTMRTYLPRFKERLDRFRKRVEKHRDQAQRALTMSAAQFPHLKPPCLDDKPGPAAPSEASEEPHVEIPMSAEADPLTGLPPRSDALNALNSVIKSGNSFYLVAVILDQMSMMLQRYGPEVADDVVLFHAQLIAQNLRPGEHTFRWSDRALLCLLYRKSEKHVLRDELNYFLGVRYRKNVVLNGRSAMINVGASVKIWHSSEIKSVQQYAEALDAHLMVVAA